MVAATKKGKTKKKEDPLSSYEKALELLGKQEYSKAKNLLAEIETSAEKPELAARARTLQRLCVRQLDGEVKASSKASAEELFNHGVFEHNRGNYREALNYFQTALKKGKDLDFVYYAMAASAVGQNEEKEALKFLEKAIKLDSSNRFHAVNDPDFRKIAESKGFRTLIGEDR